MFYLRMGKHFTVESLAAFCAREDFGGGHGSGAKQWLVVLSRGWLIERARTRRLRYLLDEARAEAECERNNRGGDLSTFSWNEDS